MSTARNGSLQREKPRGTIAGFQRADSDHVTSSAWPRVRNRRTVEMNYGERPRHHSLTVFPTALETSVTGTPDTTDSKGSTENAPD